jgi:dipeptidyl aminopeptidase/acylaminoacyl peptidase
MSFRRGQIRAAWVGVAAAVAVAAGAGAAEKRLITETDLFRFVWIGDPQISPDGRRVAFVRVTVNSKKEGYDTAIWVVPTDGSEAPRAFTNGMDTNPRWSPDGTRLAFNRVVEKDGKPQPPQLWVISSQGGEARALTDLPKGAGPAAWSPDGTQIVFTSTTTDKDLAKKDAKPDKDKDKAKEDERESDVRVITRAVYRLNGPGYLDPTRPPHLWTIEVPATGGLSKPKRLTSGEFGEANPTWSRGGKRIFFLSNRNPEPYYSDPDTNVYSIPVEGGEIEKAADIDGPIDGYSFTNGGRRIAFTGNLNGKPPRSYDQPDLFISEVGPRATAVNLTAGYDFDIDGGAAGDQRAPRGSQPSDPVWVDLNTLIVKACEKGRVGLKKIHRSPRRVESLTEGDEEVMSYTATPDAARIAMVVSTPTAVGDLFVLETAGKRPRRQLTRFNDALFAELELTPPEELWYTSFDGKKIHALVQKPPRFEKGQKYPLILNIHGGPHAAYGYTFFHEMQWMAAKGYVVLYPNPRGSSAYGQDFGNVIQYHYPGDDYKDLMAGVDELIQQGVVDPERLGVTGGSGGGVLTNWAVTQTDRFKAAVSQRSISDWAGWWYTADFTLFTPRWFRGAPFEESADYAARSAITHVGRVKTPLMLIEGETDWRTPASGGGEQMFRALKYLKKPTVMVRFPDESHELSRSGKPWHRIERLQHIVGWFDKHVLGKEVAGYEVP